MTFSCCICEATSGEIKPARIREGMGSPTCSECHAKIYWRSRQPQPQQITAPLASYELAGAQATLAAAGG
jgi:hypothetical protein